MFTIEIPELEYENVSVQAKDVKTGDVVIVKGARHKVAEVKRGPKWTTLLDKVGGTIVRLENDDTLLVHTPTEASLKAQYEAEYRLRVNTLLRKNAAEHVNRSKTKDALLKI